MNFLKSQSPRERGLIYGAMALLLLLGIWQFAIKPVLKSGDVAERAQSHALRDFAIVRDGAGALGANSAQTGARKPFDRKAIIDIARSASLPISRVQPQSDTVIKVWFDDAPSRSVYQFLSAMEQDYAVKISRVQINRRDGGGVSAQISLEGL